MPSGTAGPRDIVGGYRAGLRSAVAEWLPGPAAGNQVCGFLELARCLLHLWPMSLRNGMLMVLLLGSLGGCEPRRRLGGVRFSAAGLAAARMGQGEVVPAQARGVSEGRLEEYILLALRHHPRLRSQYERWAAARLRVDQAAVLPNPEVTYAFFARPVHTRVGAQRHRLSLRQRFPWPGTRQARRRGAQARAEAEGERLEAMGLELRRQVSEAWWALWELREQRRWRREQLILLEAIEEALRSRLELGGSAATEVLRVGMRLSRARDALRALDDDERMFVATLEERIGVKVEGFPTAGAPERMVFPVPGEAQLIELVQGHPFLQRQGSLGQALLGDADARSARGLPAFSVGFDWIAIDRQGTSPEAGDDALALQVGIAVPLWGGAERRAGEAARADARSAEFERDALELALVAEVRRSLVGLRDAGRRARVVREELLPQGQAVYEAELAALTIGERGVTDVLEAQGQLLELGLELLAHRRRYGQSWARLEAAVGVAIEAAGEEP